MPDPTNADVADVLDRYGTLLELSGEGPFRVRAYRRAAEAIRYLLEPIAAVGREGRLRAIPGVGEGIAAAVAEYLGTGRYRPLEELGQRVPLSLLDLLALPGIGVKTANRLYRELGIVDLAGLETALNQGRLAGLRGPGGRLEATVRAGLESLQRRTGRIPLGVALPVARELQASIAETLPRALVGLAGSARRMEETVGDLDIVVGGDDLDETRGALASLAQVAQILAEEDGVLRVRLQSGLQADLVATPAAGFGTALVRATGSPSHLSLLGSPLPQARTEEDLYAALGLPWIPPELRQGGAEVQRAGEIDRLVTLADIGGEFHSHTTWSDGSGTVAEMAAAAAARGYRFLGISDHSQGLGVANGLDPARLSAQRREIDALTATGQIRVYAGAEVEVTRDGRLDFPDPILAELDFVIASLHVGLRQPREEITGRLVRVLKHPHVDIIAHPSGRLIERREGGDFDWERVFEVAARTGTALEINADPARLDLNDHHVRRALDAGCVLTINCDAHHPSGFGLLEYGIAVARRAWARPEHILNCWPVDRIEDWLRHRSR